MTSDQRLEQLREKLGAVALRDVKPRTADELWLIPNIVHATNTLLYGTSSAGKSLAVAHIIASLRDGREFLGIKPSRHGLSVLVLCSDRGAEQEYRERLDTLGIDTNTGDIEFLRGVGIESPEWWNEVHEFARRAGHDLVVVDHASGVIDGNELEREPWAELWQQRLSKFDLPVLLVAHSSDYAGAGGPSHRVRGNSAASNFSRNEVEIYRTNANAYVESARVLRTKSRDGLGIERRYRIDGGVMVLDDQAEQQAEDRARQRSKQALDNNERIAWLAVQSAGESTAAVAREIAGEAGLSANTLRLKKLPSLVDQGLLNKTEDTAGGIYSPGEKLGLAVV